MFAQIHSWFFHYSNYKISETNVVIFYSLTKLNSVNFIVKSYYRNY